MSIHPCSESRQIIRANSSLYKADCIRYHQIAAQLFPYFFCAQVFEEMKTVGKLKPTATTYGCLLMVCARRSDVDKAFQLYGEAYGTGVLATDECHNILIGICSDAGR